MQRNERVGVLMVRLALVAMASAASAGAMAQEAGFVQDPDVKSVVVTGSHIKTVDTETASPVQVITRADIQRQGVTNLTDLISNVAASTGGLSDIGGDGTFAPGASNVSLRNLGTQSTLILLNGRRIAPYGFANFTDVFSNTDSIPIDAVERVEILKTGASAIYGSDAVAGVINVITRQNYQGVEVSGDSSRSLQSHTFDTNKASITAGFGDLEQDGYNIMVNADVFKRDNVMWTNLLKYTNPALTSMSPSFGSYSSYSYPGNIIDANAAYPLPGCTTIQDGLCKYNRYERFQAVPESDRQNLFITGTFNLGGGTQAFSEISYSKSKTYYLEPYAYYGDGLGPVQWGNPTTGQSLTFNYLGLLASSPLNPTGDDGVGLRYRFVDAPTYNNIDASQYRVLGGLRGSLKEYEWEAAVGFMGSRAVETQQGTFSSSGFISEIGNYNNYTADLNAVALNYQTTDPNFFNQPNGYHPGQANSAAVLNTLFPVFGNTGENRETFADAKITGPLFAAPAGMANFALGGELRHESMNLDPSANLLDGDIVGYGSSSAASSRTTEALYTELSIPVTKKLEAQVAARLDKFPDISTHFSPKLALRYVATDSLLLRGTFETGFRAPNLVEAANSTKYSYSGGTSDPERCPAANQLYNALVNQANSLAPNNPQVALLYAQAESVQSAACAFGLQDEVKNNPALKPESSKSFSLGLVFEPVRGYSTSLDYWHIDRNNTIGLPSIAQLLNGGPLPAGTTLNRLPYNPATDPIFNTAEVAAYGITPLGGPLTGVVQQMENISEQNTSGIDLGAKISANAGVLGKLFANADGVYTLKYYDTSVSTSTENLVGQYGYPHFVANFTVGFEKDTYSNSLRLNYTGGYALQEGQSDVTWDVPGCEASGLSAQQCHVSEGHTFDYAFSYTGVKNLMLGVNVLNIFNAKQPADFRAFGIDGIIPTSLQDAQGRMLRLSANYKFK